MVYVVRSRGGRFSRVGVWRIARRGRPSAGADGVTPSALEGCSPDFCPRMHRGCGDTEALAVLGGSMGCDPLSRSRPNPLFAKAQYPGADASTHGSTTNYDGDSLCG